MSEWHAGKLVRAKMKCILLATCTSQDGKYMPQGIRADTVRKRRLLWAGALLRMGDHRFPKRVMSGELENAAKRGPGGKEKE